MLVDDCHGRLIVYSSHSRDIDAVRTATILSRDSPADAERWVRSFPLAKATEPVRLPPNHELGMQARVCMPVRSGAVLLGFMWLIDADESLSNEQLAEVAAAGSAIAVVMHERRSAVGRERARGRELLRDLLAGTGDRCIRAAGRLVEEDFLAGGAPAAAIVAHPPIDGVLDDSRRSALAGALDTVARTLHPRTAVYVMRPTHGVLVVLQGAGQATAREVADSVHAACGAYVVGVGEPCGLADVARSYWQAGQAVRVARRSSDFGPVVAWSELGIYGILSRLPLDELIVDDLHPALVRLLGDAAAPRLCATLECYLDAGCDARAAAATLSLQRGSMYHRLQRIEHVAGVDLRHGSDRLALHLGLKLARLAGWMPEETPERRRQSRA